MLKELKVNKDKELKEIREMIYQQNENVRGIEIVWEKKKNQTEIMELKNIKTELKKLQERFNSGLKQEEEKINTLKNRSLEINESEEQKEKGMKKCNQSLED